VLPGHRSGRAAFALFDSRKRFGGRRAGATRSAAQPRLHLFPAGPLVPLFGAGASAPVVAAPPPELLADARPLARRLEALRLALEDLPRQARRLARWRARRMSMPQAKFTSPLRPGRAPGQRRREEHPVDRVLEECHWVARLALEPDTS
jgi:hypothetical protein